MTTRRVVVGYDGSECSRMALTWGMRAAQARHVPLLIAHAGYTPTAPVAGFVTLVEPDPQAMIAADEEMLAAAAHEARREVPDVQVDTASVTGAVVPTLLELMADADLAVVGHRGLGTFRELLVGSTAVQLASHVHCPLVVVRSSEYVEPGPEAGRIVVGVDGSTLAGAAAGFAFEEAALRGCGLTAVYAWQVPTLDTYGWGPEITEPMVTSHRGHADEALAQSLASWTEKFPAVPVRHRVESGEAAAALVRASAGAEVLVVGARGTGGFGALRLGSVAHTLLHHAHSAVAVIRTHR